MNLRLPCRRSPALECPAVERISLFCFGASYFVAFALELWHQLRPRPVQRLFATLFGAAGLVAQTLYLGVWQPPLAWQFGILLVLAWILSIFYLFGSIHRRQQAWGLFVLPLILILVSAATVFGPPTDESGARLAGLFSRDDRRLLYIIHGSLALLAAVGVCVGFLASVMYLVQARRLKVKLLPGQGLKLPSLERLEAMNDRALTLAFPLLTAGMGLGVWLMLTEPVATWNDPRVLSTLSLWLVFVVLLLLRFSFHLRGRRVALLTIAAFTLLLVTLIVPHMGRGGLP